MKQILRYAAVPSTASVGVDMPITGAVVEVVEGRASIEDMGRMLLARPQKMDGWKIELV